MNLSRFSLRLCLCALALAVALSAAPFAAAQDAVSDRLDNAGAPARTRLADEALFYAESDAAMSEMHDGMAVEPTGDIDRDFVAMMAPHHQGAIDMAIAYLRYGRSEPLKRLAQEIIVTQKQEIDAMQLAIGHAPLQSGASGPLVVTPTPRTDTISGDSVTTGGGMK